MKHIVFALCWLIYLVQASLFEQPFVFTKAKTKCALFSSCKIPVLIRTNINSSSINIDQQQDNNYFGIVKIQKCNKPNITLELKLACQDKVFDQVEANLTGSYKRAFIFIDTNLIGRGVFTLNHDLENLFGHNVTITSPNRFIDKFHTVYVIVNQVIISIMMGLLVDLDAVQHIFKLPIGLFIGLSNVEKIN
jgi:hypothetical protein